MAHTEEQAHAGAVTVGRVAFPSRFHVQHEALGRPLEQIGHGIVETGAESPGKRILDVLRIDVHADTAGEVRNQ